MNLLQALILGIVEGVTEFLPVSSTGHLTIVEKLFGLKIDSAGVTAFTAIIQVGAIVAVLVFFRSDIARIVVAWVRGIRHRELRVDPDYRLAWFIIIGSIPIGLIGFAAKDFIAGGLRNLWVVVVALLVWSVVMVVAERVGRRTRPEAEMTIKDALVIGLVQCLALVPGVSRSGATISAGLFRNFNRVAATKISFFLSIPALVAAGGYEAATQGSAVGGSVGWIPTIVATIVSFVVAYVAIAWLLRLVTKHSISVFVGYRVGLAVVVAALLLAGVISAT
ncbi:MAG: pyrophosphate phosphatase [Glaciihabitans sp.]|nr:pyrophosphate phosphatase [Glaciihabitans sp.]MDQ1572114.1 undecaprenyl-diphosphatase [Actinomycetota bacterium]